MSGDARNYSHRGIIPRALQHVFRDVDMRSDRIYSISVSYLEIYNEALRDLLADNPAAASDSLAILDDAANTVVGGGMILFASCFPARSKPLAAACCRRWCCFTVPEVTGGVRTVRHLHVWLLQAFSATVLTAACCPAHAALHTLQVRGLTKVPVCSEEEALRQFFLGEQARSTTQHALNAASSRSHVLFTLHIEMRASAEAEERALLSKLHLVDLAGEAEAASS